MKGRNMTCGTCRFWNQKSKGVRDGVVMSHCCAEAPRIFQVHKEDHEYETVWPVTRADQFCGAYQQVKVGKQR